MNKPLFWTSIGALLAGYDANAFNIKQKPNILVFIADDAGMDYGCYGNPFIKTPNIDALAANGLMVQNAFLTAPQSSPSRTSMLSGCFAHSIGTEDLHAGLNDTTLIVPSYLKQQGYYSGLMLKSHMGSNAMKQFDWTDNGFNDWLKGEWHNKALSYFNEFLDKSENNPFFLWVAFVDPHRPYTEDPILANRAPEVHNPLNTIVPPFLVDTEQTRIDIAHYYDEIHRMDTYIGLMMQELKKRKLDENTLILYISDNGMPFPRSKGIAVNLSL